MLFNSYTTNKRQTSILPFIHTFHNQHYTETSLLQITVYTHRIGYHLHFFTWLSQILSITISSKGLSNNIISFYD